MSFAEALEECVEALGRKPNVLLGNGFSIACRPECFNYEALLEEATFDGATGDMRALFELLGTTDFERVIEHLRLSAQIAEFYSQESAFVGALNGDAEIVREALATTLAARHPDLPFDISTDEYTAVRTFLSSFDRTYTLNYDMLLYWAVMQDGEPVVARNDGFTSPDDPDAEYVVWEPYLDFGDQRIFFMHGGLHLYDRGAEISKITYSRTSVPLVEQIRAALAEGRYPLVVTEGTSRDKEAQILHNAYLNHALRSFAKLGNALFIFGHSLAQNDEHILRRIAEGRMKRLYVSVFGDPDNDGNLAIRARAEALGAGRSPANPLLVRFFDAATASVWG